MSRGAFQCARRNRARRLVARHATPAVLHERPDYDDVANDDRRRVHAELKAFDRSTHALEKINAAVLPEVANR